MARPASAVPGGAAALTPKRLWQTITIATLVLLPAFWGMLAGIVAAATDESDEPAGAGAALALGVAIVPFVFVVLAFMSGHPKAPMAVVRAMGLALLVGVPVSALAADAVTGIVAGVGAGGVVALRPNPELGWKPRAWGVVVAALYAFVLLRAVSVLALLTAPVLPLTAIGLAETWVEHRREQERAREAEATAA